MSTSNILEPAITKVCTNMVPLSKDAIDEIYAFVIKKTFNTSVYKNKQAVFVGFVNSVLRDAWVKTMEKTLPVQYSMVCTGRDTEVAITMTGVHADELAVAYAMKKLLNHEKITLNLLTDLNAKCKKLLVSKKIVAENNSNHLCTTN